MALPFLRPVGRGRMAAGNGQKVTASLAHPTSIYWFWGREGVLQHIVHTPTVAADVTYYLQREPKLRGVMAWIGAWAFGSVPLHPA